MLIGFACCGLPCSSSGRRLGGFSWPGLQLSQAPVFLTKVLSASGTHSGSHWGGGAAAGMRTNGAMMMQAMVCMHHKLRSSSQHAQPNVDLSCTVQRHQLGARSACSRSLVKQLSCAHCYCTCVRLDSGHACMRECPYGTCVLQLLTADRAALCVCLVLYIRERHHGIINHRHHPAQCEARDAACANLKVYILTCMCACVSVCNCVHSGRARCGALLFCCTYVPSWQLSICAYHARNINGAPSQAGRQAGFTVTCHCVHKQKSRSSEYKNSPTYVARASVRLEPPGQLAAFNETQ